MDDLAMLKVGTHILVRSTWGKAVVVEIHTDWLEAQGQKNTEIIIFETVFYF